MCTHEFSIVCSNITAAAYKIRTHPSKLQHLQLLKYQMQMPKKKTATLNTMNAKDHWLRCSLFKAQIPIHAKTK